MAYLPPELYRGILQHISLQDLRNVTLVSRSFRSEADFFLFHTVESPSLRNTEYLCQTIAYSTRIHPYVVSLTIHTKEGDSTTALYWHKLAIALKCLTHLSVLSLHPPVNEENDMYACILPLMCSLTKLRCGFALDAEFVRFLRVQHNLTDLYITGELHPTSLDVLPQGILPNLRAIQVASADLALALMSICTITHAWIDDPNGHSSFRAANFISRFAPLAATVHSLRADLPSIRHLLVSTLTFLSRHAPELRSLGTLPYFDPFQDKVVSDALSSFKYLQFVVFNGAINSFAARVLAEACPSLRCIVCRRYSYAYDYLVLPVNPSGRPRGVHDPTGRLWRNV